MYFLRSSVFRDKKKKSSLTHKSIFLRRIKIGIFSLFISHARNIVIEIIDRSSGTIYDIRKQF